MHRRSFLVLLLGLAACVTARQPAPSAASEPDARFFEMRVYYAAPGKLDALHARFRDHTMALFEKHGMTNVGYWVPVENPENKLVYLLAYPSREARDQAWKAFSADPDWQAAKQASEAGGSLVSRVESTFLRAVDYSPAIRPSVSGTPRVFELRTYTAMPGRLADVHARFRDHTVDLFTRHGMTHIGYWQPVDADRGADDTLVYILAHPSREAARAAFAAFGKDPDWIAARDASEADGRIVERVESVFMTATDYSPIK